MRAYEERKAEAAKKPDGTADKKKQTTSDGEGDGDDEDRPRPMTGDGMMAGVVPGAGGKAEAKLLPVTAFGRYMKVLLSSGEFLFVN